MRLESVTSKTERLLKEQLYRPDNKFFLAELQDHHPPTYLHTLEVAKYAVSLGFELGLNSEQMDYLCRGALRHDQGKTVITTKLIDNPNKLAVWERYVMQVHVNEGFSSLRDFKPYKTPWQVLEIVLKHHNYIKDGYPPEEKWRSLLNELPGYRPDPPGITDLAAIVALADMFEALLARRAYKEPKSLPEARGIIQNEYTGPKTYINQMSKLILAYQGQLKI